MGDCANFISTSNPEADCVRVYHTYFPGNLIQLLLTALALGPLTSSDTISLELSFPQLFQTHISSSPSLPPLCLIPTHTEKFHLKNLQSPFIKHTTNFSKLGTPLILSWPKFT